jgi:hypothetical protein
MARGNDGQKIFLRESDHQAFIDAGATPLESLHRDLNTP